MATDQTQSLIYQIKTLEAQLVKRTSEVLKNTEMLKEYKHYKQEAKKQSL